MAECYHDSATFSDENFRDLDAPAVRVMWRMFNTCGRDLVVKFGKVKIDNFRGRTNWDAFYTFSATGR